MPTLPPAPGTIKLILSGHNTLNTWKFSNILHGQKADASAWSTSDFTALWTVLSLTTGTTNPLLGIAAAQDSDIVWSQATGVELSATGLSSVQPLNVSGALTGASNIGIPPNGCAVASWQIARRLRGGHPRTYFAGVVQSQMNTMPGVTFTTAGQSAWLSAMQNFLTRFNAISIGTPLFVLGALSYYDKAVNPTPPHLRTTPVFFPFQSVKMHPRLDSQRRRLGKEII
jgi:hypothetical protein